MRRSLNIAFTIVYLSLTVGLTFVVHFCGAELASVGLAPLTSTQTSCCCGDEEQQSPCCDTQQTTLQISDEHLTSAPPTIAPLAGEAPVLFAAEPELARYRLPVSAYLTPSPPGHPPLNVLYCTFLI
jgi:hypothetical protein